MWTTFVLTTLHHLHTEVHNEHSELHKVDTFYSQIASKHDNLQFWAYQGKESVSPNNTLILGYFEIFVITIISPYPMKKYVNSNKSTLTLMYPTNQQEHLTLMYATLQ